MGIRNIHEWRSSTAEGDRRDIRAEKFGGRWRIQAKLKGEEAWTYYDVPLLEDLARDHGATASHLETNRALSEAIALYRASGYEEVDAFNDEPYAHFWFEKRLRRSR